MTNSPTRVLMVMDSMGTGGTETHVLSLARTLQSRGIQLHYAGADGPFHSAFVDAGFHIHLVESSMEPLPVRNQQLNRAYRRVLEEHQISIVHVHQTPSGLLAAGAAVELGIPVVYTMHGTYYPPREAVALAQLSDAMISVSKPVQTFWNRQGIESCVISNGIDFEAFHPDPNVSMELRTTTLCDLPQNASVVTYVSRLAWQKASVCNMLLRATKTLTDMSSLHMVVVGTGAQSHYVDELAQALNKLKGYPYIHVVGEQTDVRPYYALSDLVVGTGRVALEAMACGKPVLAVGNHGYFGLVTPEAYPRAWEYYFGDHNSSEKPSPPLLAHALRQAFADRQRLERWGEQGKDWIKSSFDITQKGAELLAVYERCMRKQ